MENSIKMDDLGVPLFSETPICYYKMTVLFLNTFHHISRRFQLANSSPSQKKSQEFHEVVDAGLGQLAFYNTNLQSYMEMTDKA